LAERVRERAGHVVFIQHDSRCGDEFAPFTPGWPILRSIQQRPGDRIVRKTLNDAFLGTSLQSELAELGVQRLLVTGWATDFCVDATVGSAAALGFKGVRIPC
jgi:nicotinamidase-related amidase